MELEGLKESLMFLERHGIAAQIVNDTHTQVKHFLRKEKQSIKHRFDVWPMAKGTSEQHVSATSQFPLLNLDTHS